MIKTSSPRFGELRISTGQGVPAEKRITSLLSWYRPQRVSIHGQQIVHSEAPAAIQDRFYLTRGVDSYQVLSQLERSTQSEPKPRNEGLQKLLPLWDVGPSSRTPREWLSLVSKPPSPLTLIQQFFALEDRASVHELEPFFALKPGATTTARNFKDAPLVKLIGLSCPQIQKSPFVGINLRRAKMKMTQDGSSVQSLLLTLHLGQSKDLALTSMQEYPE